MEGILLPENFQGSPMRILDLDPERCGAGILIERRGLRHLRISHERVE